MTDVYIPSHVQYFMANWNDGYKFGYRDGKTGNSYVTNFSQEKHGFMSGYFIGYIDAVEKRKGRNFALDIMSDISRGHDTLQITAELDRQGNSPEEEAQAQERHRERVKKLKLKQSK